MLQPTLDKLCQMKLFGMAKALEELLTQPQVAGLSFEERLAILVDRDADLRENKQLTRLLNNAKLKQQACIEDIDFRQPRGLDRSAFFSLADCRWVKEHHKLIVTGPTGVGKTYIACALANKACRLGYSVRYWRTSRLLQAITVARADGSYNTMSKKLQKTDVLLLDDWGISPFQAEEARDLFDIIEDRNQTRSTMITTQLPISQWYSILPDPTLADAILDRLVHNAHKIDLRGDSMRKLMSKLD